MKPLRNDIYQVFIVACYRCQEEHQIKLPVRFDGNHFSIELKEHYCYYILEQMKLVSRVEWGTIYCEKCFKEMSKK